MSNRDTLSTNRRLFLGLFQRRECVIPTWRGLFLFLAASAAAIVLFVRNVEGFLSENDPQPGGVLVIEGWASDYIMAEAIDEFHSHDYVTFLVTGGPIDKGAPFSKFRTYAEFGEATLERMGVPTDKVHAVPAPEVDKDRTYASAVALKAWLIAHSISTENVNVLSMGIHCRRSRMLFRMAFGPGTNIGIVALKEPDLRNRPWWVTSVGVRSMISEAIAYFYARFLFMPDRA